MSMKKYLLAVTMFLLATTALVSCSNDDEKNVHESMSSVISFENILEVKDFVESGTFMGIGNTDVNAPVILPGQSINFTFHAGKGASIDVRYHVWSL